MCEIIPINENSWRIEDHGVRFFLLTGSKKALMIDSGMQTPNARAIAESLTDLPLQVLNTHGDPDHISGNEGFDAVFLHPLEEPVYRAHGGKGEIVPVKEGDVIDLGNRPLKIVELFGHTPGSIAILDVNHRALISGDSIQDGRIYMFGAHRNLPKYVETLSELSRYEGCFDVIYPSHGSFPISPAVIPELIAAAKQILCKEAEGEQIDLFGRSVMLYSFAAGSFLCEGKNTETEM